MSRWSTKGLVLGCVALCVFLPLIWGCASSKPADTPRGRLLVVVLDLSGSTLKYRSEYKSDIEKIIGGLDYGDRLVAFSVDRDSIANSRLLADTTLPVFQKTANMKNDLMVAKGRQQFESQNPLATVRSSAAEQVLAALDETASTGSDILGALELASQQFERSAASSKSLVMVSDMVLGVPSLGMNFAAGKTMNPATEFAKLQRAGSIPKLNGVNVVVVGAVARDQTRWKQIRDFWSRYFKEAGAVMPSDQYGRRLSQTTADRMFTNTP